MRDLRLAVRLAKKVGKNVGGSQILLRTLPQQQNVGIWRKQMSTSIYWFRNDLRLLDNPAFTLACGSATKLVPVFIHEAENGANAETKTAEKMRWGFVRVGSHRQHFLASTLADLTAQLVKRGSRLVELHGQAEHMLRKLAELTGATTIFCEEIAAPEEQSQINALRAAGLNVVSIWQSTLLAPEDLPFPAQDLPPTFTAFRHAIEKSKRLPPAPLPVPAHIPPLPAALPPTDLALALPPVNADSRSSFPYATPSFAGGESAALAHLAQYFAGNLVDSYKLTRNGLSGIHYSTKFSPWLATGALSARCIYAALAQFETQHGANEGSYWLWFELLWRDYFRLLHVQHGVKLYRARGLADEALAAPTHHPSSFLKWCKGETSEPIVNAGMRELAATGYLSNRLRQIVASYLIHDLACDWRAGAAWFESQLIDYDVYSNQGNWLYLAGRGTDPRSGRRFNPQKQAQDYDPAGHYRALWKPT